MWPAEQSSPYGPGWAPLPVKHTADEIDEVALAGFTACYPVKDWEVIGGYARESWLNEALRALTGKGLSGAAGTAHAAMVAKAAEVNARRAAASDEAQTPWRDLPHAEIARALANAWRSEPPVKVTIIDKRLTVLADKLANGDIIVGVDYQGAEAGPYVSTTPPAPAKVAQCEGYGNTPCHEDAGPRCRDHAAPDPTRAPLDAMLRFVCGHPQGVRWLGERDHADVQRIARAFRPDRKVEHKSCEPLASCLLTKLRKLPGTTLARWLSVDEQREYNRLFAALKSAVDG